MANDAGIKLVAEGEKQFKSALADINRELKVSASEMALLAAKYDSSDKSIEAMTARQQALEKQLSKQKSAVDTITAALENAKESFGENDKRTLAWQEALNKAQAEVIKTEKAIEKNSAAMDEMSGEAKDGTKAESEMGTAVKKTAEEIAAQEKATQDARKTLADYADAAQKKAAVAIAALGTAAIGAAKGLTSMVLSSADAANDLGDVATKTGISTTKLQEYSYAAEQAGTSLDTITGAQTKLVSALSSAASGTGASAEAFKKLGVSVKDSNGRLRDADSVFNDVIDALGKIDNETERDAAAMKLFGKSARELNPLIKAGSAQLNAYKDEAHELGIVVSEEAVSALGNLSLEAKKTSHQFEAFKQNIAAKLEPAISKTFEAIQKVFADLNDQLDNPKINAAIDRLGDSLGDFLEKGVDLAIKALPKLADAAGWLLENFDKLAIGVGSVWALFKGVSVVTGAVNAFNTVKGAVSALTTASQAATVAQEGMAAASSAAGTGFTAILGPAGLAVAAIAAVTLAVGAAVKKQKEHRKEITQTSTEISEKTKSIVSAADSARESYERTVGKTEAAAEAAKHYIERMKELEARGKLTNAEMAEYNVCLAKVKGLLPDINIEINKQTGLLQSGAGALEQQIDKWHEKVKLEAMSNLMTDALEHQIDLQLQMNRAQQDYNDKLDAYYDAIGKASQNPLSREMQQLQADAYAQLQAASSALREVGDAYNEATREANQMADAYNEAAAVVGDLGEASEETAVQTGEMSDAVSDASGSVDELAESLEEAGKEADAFAEEHLKKVLDGAQNMFQTIDTGSATSMKELIKTLQRNQEVITEWDDNLAKIYERGASEEFVEYLESLGVGYAAQVEMIANSTDKNFKALTSQWEKNTAAAYESGEEYGKMVAKGVEDGMDSKREALKRASRRSAKAIAAAFTEFLEIHSPSGLMRRKSAHIPEGEALGIIDKIPLLERASIQAAKAVERKFKPTLDLDFGAAMDINKEIGSGLSSGFEGAGAKIVNYYYITDPSPEYHEYVMSGVNNGLGGVYA